MEVKKCAICGNLSGVLQICQACRRHVCTDCFELVSGFCSECHNRLNFEAPSWSLPMKLIFSGFVLTFAGIVLMIVAASLYGASAISGGAVIMIGPIPILLGAGPYSFLAVLLAIALTIICLVFFLTLKRMEKTN